MVVGPGVRGCAFRNFRGCAFKNFWDAFEGRGLGLVGVLLCSGFRVSNLEPETIDQNP